MVKQEIGFILIAFSALASTAQEFPDTLRDQLPRYKWMTITPL